MGTDTGLVVLDGSEGEGGGQILRSALSLSLVTGRPFRISNIRANRKPSGLRPQHLACVRGAELISGAHSKGAEVGASELEFFPAPVKPGEYLLEVGTAGSSPLLLQCLYYPLALAGGGQLTLRGGTHLPHSPSYHYLAWVWLRMLAAYGLGLELHLKHAGFYPQGGGEIRAIVPKPSPSPERVTLPSRGNLQEVGVTSYVGGLPFSIAERQGDAAAAGLREQGIYSSVEHLPLPVTVSRGTAVFVRAQFEHSLAGFTALGERGKPAEEVGREAASEVGAFMRSAGAIDEHLGDQILVPAALHAAGILGAPGETSFTAAALSGHLKTNAKVLMAFLPSVSIALDESGSVKVTRASLS